MSKGYLQTKVDGEEAYIRMNSLDKLRNVDAVIFDCDGVLIDVRESYNRAIPETVAYVVKELTGFPFPKNLVSREIIHSFKKSGGFNNDWDLVYAILMFILCNLPESFQEVFKKYMSPNRYRHDPFRRFLYVKEGVRKEYTPRGLDAVVIKLEAGLKEFAEMFDVSGIASIEKRLVNLENVPRSCYGYYASVKRFLSHPGDVSESIITRVFEEVFCGPQLFRDMYKRVPRFYQGRGFIEDERVIVLPKTLDQLASILGKPNFGISSGRPLKLAKYTLKGLLEKFSPEALVFLGEVGTAERENVGEKGSAVNLGKPHPFSLLASSKGLEPFKFALYVGDSMEDVIMVKEANKLDSRFLSAGVYGCSDCKEELLRSFLKAGSDLLLPSVNELPVILKTLKEKETT